MVTINPNLFRIQGSLQGLWAQVRVGHQSPQRVRVQNVGSDGASATEHAPPDEIWDDSLHVQGELHLHSHPLEGGLLLDGLDVVYSQTDLGNVEVGEGKLALASIHILST